MSGVSLDCDMTLGDHPRLSVWEIAVRIAMLNKIGQKLRARYEVPQDMPRARHARASETIGCHKEKRLGARVPKLTRPQMARCVKMKKGKRNDELHFKGVLPSGDG